MKAKFAVFGPALAWLVVGVCAETYALKLLLDLQPIAAGLAHLSAAGSLSLCAAQGQLPSRHKQALAVFLLVLSLPVLGVVGTALVVLPAWASRRPEQDDNMIEIGLPVMDDSRGDDVERQETEPIEKVLCCGAAAHRVDAVMTLRRMSAERALPLLRVALLDPSEEVRLLAYAIIERREKELRAQIEHALQALEAQATPQRRAALHKTLAERHWELAYGQFVSGELLRTALDAATRHGHASLVTAPDGALAVLLGRVRLRASDAPGALRYLRAAAALGVAECVLAPLYAEAAFLLRRFHSVRPLLARARRTATARPRLELISRFWNTPESV